MTAIASAMQQRFRGSAAGFRAASACSADPTLPVGLLAAIRSVAANPVEVSPVAVVDGPNRTLSGYTAMVRLSPRRHQRPLSPKHCLQDELRNKNGVEREVLHYAVGAHTRHAHAALREWDRDPPKAPAMYSCCQSADAGAAFVLQ